MKESLELILWPLAFYVVFVVLIDFDVFLKKLVGRKNKTAALKAKMEALETRVAQLERRKRA